ncbi:hypothetical protein RB620_24670 [Paenibacillus sp. LHD-117]|uniref:hypothetical protein n=1 Tax=Paenibacillus sp. LHD-117 TaxID=3071412 RepID=UPI0027DEE3C0|nr:hypothetical protein [Paenibacillus sp. LHD-117]MDQ6422631.1 hypothetical protein [Paenibacillus sp. LHD-117]
MKRKDERDLHLVEAMNCAAAARRIGEVIHLLDLQPVHAGKSLSAVVKDSDFLREVLRQMNDAVDPSSVSWIWYGDNRITVHSVGGEELTAQVLPQFVGMMHAMHRRNNQTEKRG